MLEHHRPIPLHFSSHESTAYSAKVPASSLLVFVHGFTGHPIATWDGFGEALLSDAALSGTDIIFYGYDSVQTSAIASAHFFRQFVDALCGTGPTPVRQLAGVRKEFADRAYEVIVFACHSLGAIVVRRAVLDTINAVLNGHQRPSWEQKSKMVLFAPAHAGGRPLRLASAALGSGNALAALGHALAMYKLPVLEDLDPNGDTVKTLAADIETLRIHRCALAHSIVFGRNDNVVVRKAIKYDPPAQEIPDEDHISICKLRPDFAEPLTFVKGALP